MQHLTRFMPSPTAPAPLPAGLLVPAGLATRTSRCGAPVQQEVVAEDASGDFLCRRSSQGLSTSPGTVVWLSTDSRSSPYSDVATSPAVVDGHQVLGGYSRARDLVGVGGVAGVIAVPAQHLVVGMTAPSRADVDAILGPVRIEIVDRLGCAACSSGALS